METKKIKSKDFIIVTLLTSIWINLSEVFRYFVFVRPRTKAFFDYKNGIAEIDLTIFSIWGVWDTLLTCVLVLIFWLYSKSFDLSLKSILYSATTTWAAVFVIFWVATANMGLCDWNILLLTLPLSWIEMFIGAWIASILFKRFTQNNESIVFAQ